ncbi:MAG TPA: hypothetical protein VG714_10070 [Acidobacteriaceae bacterium]|nr:hypothetical protein [Acidobacteriaceae bacterium]
MSTLLHRPAVCLSSLVLALTLGGCSISSSSAPAGPIAGTAIRGAVHGGQQPISGASVQLYAAGTTGYGLGATPLLSSPVITGSDGSFTLTGTYTCPSSSSELYLVATGGNPGLPSGSNSAIALAAALGPCNYAGASGPTLDPSTYIVVNEATTVATVYSLAQFWQPNSFIVGTSATNATGLANAFDTAATMVDNSAGTAYATTPPLNTTIVPQTKINTLADILAACVNTNGTDGTCGSFFSSVAPQNSAAPTNTISALLDIALSPSTNTPALFALVGSTAPFQPTLPYAPWDYALVETIRYPGIHNYGSVAIDSHGNAWAFAGTAALQLGIVEVSPAGDPLSGAAPGYQDSVLGSPNLLVIDGNDNVWSPNWHGVVEFASDGTDITASGPYLQPTPPETDNFWAAAASGSNIVLPDSVSSSAPNGGVIELNSAGARINDAGEFNSSGTIPGGIRYIALDASNTIWLSVNTNTPGVAALYHLDFNGNFLIPHGIGGGGLYEPRAMATDSSRNLWVLNYHSYPASLLAGTGSVSEFDSNGNPLSSAQGFADGYLYLPTAIAMDGNSTPWILDGLQGIVHLGADGTILTGAPNTDGYRDTSLPGGDAIAIDASGNLWVSSGYSPPTSTTDSTLTKFIGVAAPVATPLGVNGLYGQRP